MKVSYLITLLKCIFSVSACLKYIWNSKEITKWTNENHLALAYLGYDI